MSHALDLIWAHAPVVPKVSTLSMREAILLLMDIADSNQLQMHLFHSGFLPQMIKSSLLKQTTPFQA